MLRQCTVTAACLLAGDYNLTALSSLCNHTFGVTPDPDYAPVQYGGLDYSSASNIVFLDGEYDPWRSGLYAHVSSLQLSLHPAPVTARLLLPYSRQHSY